MPVTKPDALGRPVCFCGLRICPYAIGMIRLLLILSLFCAPLLAVTPSSEGSISLDSLDVVAVLSLVDEDVRVSIACTASLKNAGDERDVELLLPTDLVPKPNRDEFVLTIDTKTQKPAGQRDGQFYWTVHFDTEQIRTFSWTITRGVASLPQAHPLGRLQLSVPLSHMRNLVALPESFSIEVQHAGFAPELFGQGNEDRTQLREPIEERLEDFSFQWFAATRTEKTAAFAQQLEEFTDAQRVPSNRSYTRTLVSLTELYALANDHQAVADTCATLDDLETSAGRVITHCGPWAQWRKYVPWRLRQLQALRARESETSDCVESCLAVMRTRWAAYTEAMTFARPFDHFDAAKFGAFWDYDWVTTRDLYADALELSGNAQQATDVREVDAAK